MLDVIFRMLLTFRSGMSVVVVNTEIIIAMIRMSNIKQFFE